SSSLVENDYPQWAAGTTYALGARVIKIATHRMYESAIPGNVGHDPADPATTQWFDIGPTNARAMFDQALETRSAAAGSLTFTLAPGSIDAVAALEVEAASVRVQVN